MSAIGPNADIRKPPIDVHLTLNLKTAKALGITIPQSILATAEMIE
ncbi:MAG: hypothetical protein WCF37_14960 [Pseudolabrys sp.]